MASLVVPIAAILLILGITGLFLFWRTVRRTHYSPIQAVFWLVAKAFTRFQWRTEIAGPFPETRDGKAVVICNHRSSIDPFFIQTAVDRVIHWMVAREYCERGFFGWCIRVCEVVPVNRGGIDTASTKSAIRIVESGGMVGMLPEGRINRTDELLLPVRPGAVVVALKARAPIIPCYIEGSPFKKAVWSPFLMRARVRVWFGQPIDMSSDYGKEKDSEVVRRRLTECIQAIAKLAGQDDFEVKFAGRRWKTDDN